MKLKVAVTLPVVLQVDRLLSMTWRCLERLTIPDNFRRRTQAEFMLTLVCNRLAWPVEEIRAKAANCCGLVPSVVNVVNEGDKGVAGGWNAGTKLGLDWGAEYLMCLANDTEADPSCVQNLLTFGMSREDGNPLAGKVALWSGTANNDGRVLDPTKVGEGADFSFFAFRPETIQKHGWFDEMFRPAYFEDNDYAARIVLGGEHHRYVYAARFYHHVSQTAKHDAEMAHHINHWFGINRDRFIRKWGRPPVGDEATMLRDYHRTPFGSGQPLSWWGPS